MWFKITANFFSLVVAVLTLQTQVFGIPTVEIGEISENSDKLKNQEKLTNRQGRTFGFFSNYNSYPPPIGPPVGPPIGPVPPPYYNYYESYYDSGPVMFLRQVGSLLLEVLTRVILTPPLPGQYSDSYDYGGGGPTPDFQSEFTDYDSGNGGGYGSY